MICLMIVGMILLTRIMRASADDNEDDDDDNNDDDDYDDDITDKDHKGKGCHACS